MARRRTSRQTQAASRQPRRRPNQLVRQMARTLAFVPIRVTIPMDPPPINRTFSYFTTFPLQLVLSSTAGFIPGDISKDKNSRIGFTFNSKTGEITQASMKMSELYKAWNLWMRATYDAVNHMEICLIKVCYWGPSPTTTSGIEIGLEVGHSAPFSNLAARDTGGTASRARIGISSPFRDWRVATSPEVCLRIDPDAADILASLAADAFVEGFLLGTLHVTVGVKRTEA